MQLACRSFRQCNEKGSSALRTARWNYVFCPKIIPTIAINLDPDVHLGSIQRMVYNWVLLQNYRYTGGLLRKKHLLVLFFVECLSMDRELAIVRFVGRRITQMKSWLAWLYKYQVERRVG